MLPTRKGALHLFRLRGIDLYLHWSWFVVAMWQINQAEERHSSLTWNAIEYLALFLIVALHEFGHAMACRQVGGQADQIVLWPLGGVAYVAPPPRPGAILWSIAAGPLVNVLLVPVLFLLAMLFRFMGRAQTMPEAYVVLKSIGQINLALLVFNMLPIYPLDGGQILRALFWFWLGRSRSLFVTTIIGFVGVTGLGGLAWYLQSPWAGIMAGFIFMQCLQGWQQARALAKAEQAPRDLRFVCPSCQMPARKDAIWICHDCHQAFETAPSCPHCQSQSASTQCLDCGVVSSSQGRGVPPPLPV